MVELDGQSVWDIFLKKPIECNPLFLKEIIFRLEELIFGTNMPTT